MTHQVIYFADEIRWNEDTQLLGGPFLPPFPCPEFPPPVGGWGFMGLLLEVPPSADEVDGIFTAPVTCDNEAKF